MNTELKMTALLIGLTFASSFAMSQTSILGLEMGKPIALPECGTDVGQTSPCRFDMRSPDTVLLQHLPGSSNDVMGKTIDNNLEDLLITYSGSACGKAERGLRAKFGAPTGVTRSPGTTKLGIRLEIVDMTWRRKDGVELDFVQPGNQVDECIVSATTPKWRRQQKDDAIKF